MYLEDRKSVDFIYQHSNFKCIAPTLVKRDDANDSDSSDGH